MIFFCDTIYILIVLFHGERMEEEKIPFASVEPLVKGSNTIDVIFFPAKCSVFPSKLCLPCQVLCILSILQVIIPDSQLRK